MQLFILFYILKVVHCIEMDYIPETWVDPNDMRYYDRYSKSMKSSLVSNHVNDKNNPIKENGSLTQLDNELKRYEIFFERFINRFLQTSGLKEVILEPGKKIETEIPVLITTEELSKLVKIGQHFTASQLTELDKLFSVILSHNRGFSFNSLPSYLNPLQQFLYGITLEKLTVITIVLFFGVVLWMFAVGKSLKRIMVFLYLVFFMGGLAWNWWNMYLEAVVEQYVEMKRHSSIPDVCDPKNGSWFKYWLSFIGAKDECKEYHKAFQINPFSKIPPSIVLSQTLSMMLIHPMKTFGENVGDFLSGIAHAAPWPLNIVFLPIVFILSALFLLLLLSIYMGASLKFWTLFGGIHIDANTIKKHEKYSKISDEVELQTSLKYNNPQSLILASVETLRKILNHETKIEHVTITENSVFLPQNDCIENCLSSENPTNASDIICYQNDNSGIVANSFLKEFKYKPRQKLSVNRVIKNRLFKKKTT